MTEHMAEALEQRRPSIKAADAMKPDCEKEIPPKYHTIYEWGVFLWGVYAGVGLDIGRPLVLIFSFMRTSSRVHPYVAVF